MITTSWFFATPVGPLTFKKQPAALTPMRRLVELGLARDAEFRSELRRESLRAIPRGLALFVVGGGLFGLYCWYASRAPDLPPGHWIRWFGWLIHGVLLLLWAQHWLVPVCATSASGNGCACGASIRPTGAKEALTQSLHRIGPAAHAVRRFGQGPDHRPKPAFAIREGDGVARLAWVKH